MMNSKHLLAIAMLCAFMCSLYKSEAKSLGSASIQELEMLYEELFQNAKTVSSLETLPNLDSVVKLTNGSKYAIVIWNTHVEKNKATFNALLAIKIPSDDQKLIFYGENITFSNKVGIAGKIKLKLAQDLTIVKGKVMSLTFKAKDTYAEIDCHGFDKMGVEVELEFSRDYVLKETPSGNLSKERLKTTFSVQMKDFSDFLVQIHLPAFQIKGLKDFSFTASHVYFDFSDYANPPSLPLDESYDSMFVKESTGKLWHGVYMTKLAIKLPRFLSKDKKSGRLELGANNMVIDEQGFTGAVQAGGLISINQGTLGDWAFSLDALGVKLKKNELEEGFFTGKIRIPIGKEKDLVGYECSIGREGTYAFKANPVKTMSFPVLRADTVTLLSSSSISITVKDDTVRLRANLSGNMNISAPCSDDDSDTRFILGNLGFEELEVANYKPELRIKALQYTSVDAKQSPRLAQYPIQISKLRLKSESKKIMLEVELMLNLTEKFGAGGDLTLYGKIGEENGRIKYSYDYMRLNSLKVDVEVTKFKLVGKVDFFEKSREFGNGFKGQIKMVLRLSEAKPVEVQVGALFGKHRNHRYWYADGSVSGFKIPIFTGANITGFAGGAYYGMTKDLDTKSPLAKGLSGQKYVPDSTAGMGFQAGVTLAVPDPKTFTGRLLLEMAFNKGGGLRRIFLLGEGECMAASTVMVNLNEMVANINELSTTQQQQKATEQLDNDIPILKHFGDMDPAEVSNTFGAKTKNKDQLKMILTMDMNFNTNELVGNFKPYLFVGGGAIRGAYEGGLMGEGNLYFNEEKWYIHIGKPSRSIKVVVAGMAEFSAYLMVGKEMEDSPELPVEMTQNLPKEAIAPNYMRDLNALGNGAGFAFGGNFQMETGEKQFALFYYRITAGVGFDLMLKEYGSDAFCIGRTGTLGINGWYANGQAYSYLQGTVGVQVNLAFVKTRIEVLSLGTSAFLRAKLPNPAWISGTVGGYYSVLNGLVKGRCCLEVALGEPCTANKTGKQLDNIDVVAQLTPEHNQKDVSVFARPQALFNIPIDVPFSVEDPMYPGQFLRYRAVLKSFQLKNKNQQVVLGELQWNEDRTTVAYKPDEILSPKQDFELMVSIGFEQEVQGLWQAFRNDKGVVQQEMKELSFKTGPAPNHIPEENLQFTYPTLQQKNFYKEMSKVGYIQLIQGQAYLFDDPTYSPSVFLKDSKGKKVEIPVSYDIAKKNVVYALPSLNTNEIYTLSLENMPKDRNLATDKNVSTQSSDVLVASTDNSSTAVVNTKIATGVIMQVRGKVLLKYAFRTSTYGTLVQKLANHKVQGSYFSSLGDRATALGVRIHQTSEPFDEAELKADRGPNLISFEVDFKNQFWFASKLKSQLYQSYPIQGKFHFERDTSLWGFLPTRHITFNQTPPLQKLGTEEIESGKVMPEPCVYTLSANFHKTLSEDHQQISSQVAKAFCDGNDIGNYVSLLTEGFPSLTRTKGFSYPIEVFYHFPWEARKMKIATINVTLD